MSQRTAVERAIVPVSTVLITLGLPAIPLPPRPGRE